MRLYSFVAAAALASASLAAHADVMYSYVGRGSIVGGNTFTIDSPDFLTYSNTPVALTTSSDLFTSGIDTGGKLISAIFDQDFIQVMTNTDLTTVLFGGPYTINQTGTYTAGGPYANSTLTISGSPAVTPVSATPEPSSLALLGTGLLGALGVARKRFA